MIVGSGLLARAFFDRFATTSDACIYAAGVSNSTCADPTEYERERTRLKKALNAARGVGAFVYFSTCSVDDASMTNSHYIRHKAAMEALVGQHDRYLIARLPQLAGRTSNPHTLLNYLFARISRSEQFAAWANATRNVIDVEDVRSTISYIVENTDTRQTTINVACPRSHLVAEIIEALEIVVGKPAVVRWIEVGSRHVIDVAKVEPIYRMLQLDFFDGYLHRVIEKYYGTELRYPRFVNLQDPD